MAKGVGKIFEEEIKASFPSDFYVERYKDDTAGFYGVSNPADYRLYKYPYTFLLELKTHKGKSLPLDKIRDSQRKGLFNAVKHKGIYGGYLINFRDMEETYYISATNMEGFIRYTSRKSVPIEWCRENGIRINQQKKRVRYSYDLSSWLESYFGGAI